MELPKHTFTTFLSASSFLKPHRISESAWTQHVPFAYWLMEQAKPKLFVELGVHTGMSYFAFCQSVKANGLSTLCYAVDTWKGDEHAGTYGEDVWQDVQQYNTQEYSSFSYLLRSTFNDALPYFEDKTIDLLHIDGCHTYEAIKADFESWLPKMTNTGIIVFHDTVVRERNFGVYKFWAELKEQYPSFEFIHNHGLGILALGATALPVLNDLFTWKDEAEITKLRNAYAALGNSLVYDFDNAQKQLSQMQAGYEALQAQHEQLQGAHALIHQEYGVLKNLAEEIKADQAVGQLNLQAELQQTVHQLETERATAEQITAAHAALEQETTASKGAYNNCMAELEALTAAQIHSHAQYDALKQEHLQLQAQHHATEETFRKLQQQEQQANAQAKQLDAQLQRSKQMYEQLKTEHEVLKKLMVESKNNQARQQRDSEKAAQELKQKEAALQQATEAHSRLQQQHTQQAHELNRQLADVRRILSDTQTHADNLNIELARQQQAIQWYKRTYEDRSLLGTLKEKLRPGRKA